MENVADALKIAFAVFVFIVAITVSFSLISQAKSTADTVLYYSDKTNFYAYSSSTENNRDVYVSDIISTLYRYYNETISVTVKLNDYEYIFDSGNETIVKEDGRIDEDTSKKLNTPEAKKKNLANFINKVLLNYENSIFTEEFIEVPIDGIYKTVEDDEDNTEIVLSSGIKKEYVTYKLKL